MTDDPRIRARDLDWPGCVNVRDLGGLPTTDGGQTRAGVLYRSDLLYRLTPAGRDAFLAAGVRTIVDLRTAGELTRRPSPFASDGDGQGPRYLQHSLQGQDPAVEERMRAADSLAGVYVVILEDAALHVAAVLRAIAQHDDGPLVFHCHGGKDRTGIVAALLLSLADVPDALIAADYGYTTARNLAAYDALLAENGKPFGPNDLVAPPEAMQDVLNHLRATYGDVRGYLRHIGLSEAELAQLRARLRG